jgi:hypothetical protein
MKLQRKLDSYKLGFDAGRADAAAGSASGRNYFKLRRDRYLDLAERCDDVIEDMWDLPLIDDAALTQLQRQRDDLRARADTISQILRRWRSWRLFDLLTEAKQGGIDLGYTSPRKGKPHGPGIDYLMAKAAAIGKPISAHRARNLLRDYNALSAASAAIKGRKADK